MTVHDTPEQGLSEQAGGWFNDDAPTLPAIVESLERPGWVTEDDWRTLRRTFNLFVREHSATASLTRKADIAYALGRVFEDRLSDETAALAREQWMSYPQGSELHFQAIREALDAAGDDYAS